LTMSPRQLARYAARLQVAIAEHEARRARGGDPADWPHYDEAVRVAKATKREVYSRTLTKVNTP